MATLRNKIHSHLNRTKNLSKYHTFSVLFLSYEKKDRYINKTFGIQTKLFIYLCYEQSFQNTISLSIYRTDHLSTCVFIDFSIYQLVYLILSYRCLVCSEINRIPRNIHNVQNLSTLFFFKIPQHKIQKKATFNMQFLLQFQIKMCNAFTHKEFHLILTYLAPKFL